MHQAKAGSGDALPYLAIKIPLILPKSNVHANITHTKIFGAFCVEMCSGFEVPQTFEKEIKEDQQVTRFAGNTLKLSFTSWISACNGVQSRTMTLCLASRPRGGIGLAACDAFFKSQ